MKIEIENVIVEKVEVEIKLCPFCGEDEFTIQTASNKFYVYCELCGAAGPPTNEENTAVDLWNQRTDNPPPQAEKEK